MKVSREQSAKNREQILQTASREFRERGFDGVGVAELMAAAGFTHGGFYGHFESKGELMAEACTRAFDEKMAMWERLFADNDGAAGTTLAGTYLSDLHRKARGAGCPAASWAVDVSRQSGPVRRAFTEGLRRMIDALAGRFCEMSKASRRRKALATWASLVGALVLARAVDDRELSDEILKAVAKDVGGSGV